METLLPIGVQSFEDIRTTGYKYIDKTERIYRLTHFHKHVFLSRPRRFGKSLLVSTLEAYFLGRKELFKGLAIERLEKDWQEYPVLRLDLNTGNYTEIRGLHNTLERSLTKWEKQFDLEQLDKTLSHRFVDIITRVYEQTGKKIVVLVDEYDKPLISTITDPKLQNQHRIKLKDFYSVIKTCDPYIKFSLLTGITKFSKVSIFSDLNNFDDISRDSAYYDICGITESELHKDLYTETEAMAVRLKCSVDEVFRELKMQYDGYRFSKETTIYIGNGVEKDIDGIYNPFSLLNALNKKTFDSYWFETGTPTFLIERLRAERYEFKNLDNLMISADNLTTVATKELTTTQYLFQTGYLTIKDYDRELDAYTLGYPNKEVKKGFLNSLVNYFNQGEEGGEFDILNFILSLKSGNIQDFMNRLKAFFASIPYEMIPDSERHVQNVMYLLSTLCGFYCEVESHTNKGRIDLTIKTPKYIYIIELKYDQTAQQALDQIKEKGYAEQFAADERELICVGINYSSTDRNINEWLVG